MMTHVKTLEVLSIRVTVRSQIIIHLTAKLIYGLLSLNICWFRSQNAASM